LVSPFSFSLTDLIHAKCLTTVFINVDAYQKLRTKLNGWYNREDTYKLNHEGTKNIDV